MYTNPGPAQALGGLRRCRIFRRRQVLKTIAPSLLATAERTSSSVS